MQTFILLLFWFTFGFLTALIAKNKGRNPRIWFFVGVLLGVLGVALAFLIPKKGEKSSSFFSTIQKKSPPTKIENTLPIAFENPILSQQWYYLDHAQKQFGPLFFSSLRELYRQDQISDETYVWAEGMENWKKIREHLDLHQCIS